jgi:TPR repeat protein
LHGKRGLPADYSKGFAFLQKAVDANLALAQYDMATCYDRGMGGLPVSESDAVRLYRRAAAGGHPSAQFNLGNRLSSGRGVQKDVAEAVRLWHLAADQGNANAQGNLASYYLMGTEMVKEPVARNVELGAKYAILAAANGNAIALREAIGELL